MNELSLDFSFEARYYKLGEINGNTRAVWFVLHGYGQLAKYFGQKFKSLVEHNVCVIVPEGLSRFYLENMETRLQTGNSRVGSTWMTKENREMDIRNYLSYLDTLHKREIGGKHLPVTILGFSQGAATASRWAIHNQVNYERLILWAGIFPPDMNFQKGHEVLSKRDVLLTYGMSDPYINEARMKEMTMLTQKLNITPRIVTFSGGHDIDDQTLISLV